MHVGIIGHGNWIPSGRVTAADLAAATGIPEDVIALKFGVKGKPVAGPGETTAFMGLAAANKALASAGIEGGAVDLVIWCGAQHKDYPCWLAGLYVANQIGAKQAWSFDMEAMCGSMMAALDVAKALMTTHPELETVLLVSGYRNNDLIDPAVPETRFMLDIGSGGSALVLKKNAGRNAILASAFRGDGSLSEMCIVPALGSKAWPPAAGDLARAHFVVPDEPAFKAKLGEVTMPNFYAVIRESLKLSGLSERDLDYLAILHFKRSAHDAVLAELGLKPEQSTYLDEYGHLGQNDQVLSLELGLRDGKIHDGSRIVFVGAGLGFVWAATTIQWGPYSE
ncbi:MAG: 3-oxoacyl-ACP synthase [Holophagaceae bacterium]|nr:3-oxoacyl-ACP synthase [Holophagaceae bacterium]